MPNIYQNALKIEREREVMMSTTNTHDHSLDDSNQTLGQIKLNGYESTLVLAGLRMLQQNPQGSPVDILEPGTADTDRIDQLCERISTAPADPAKMIQNLLNETEDWNADTLDAIAMILLNSGYTLSGPGES